MDKGKNKGAILCSQFDPKALTTIGTHQSARHLIPANLKVQSSEGERNLLALSQVNQVLMPETSYGPRMRGSRMVSETPIKR